MTATSSRPRVATVGNLLLAAMVLAGLFVITPATPVAQAAAPATPDATKSSLIMLGCCSNTVVNGIDVRINVKDASGASIAPAVQPVGLVATTYIQCVVLSNRTGTCAGAWDPTATGHYRYTQQPIYWLKDMVRVVSDDDWRFCGILTNGTARCWTYGYDAGGTQLAQSEYNEFVPYESLFGINAIDVSRSDNHACFLLIDHAVKCRGSNGYGQLGDGTRTDRATPVDAGLQGVVSTSTTHNTSCAVIANGSVYCWGRDTGIFGVDHPSPSSCSDTSIPSSSYYSDGAYARPHYVKGVERAVSVVASTEGSVCALTQEGTFWCWGGSTDWEHVYRGWTSAGHSTPRLLPTLYGVAKIERRYQDMCAMMTDGRFACWGKFYLGIDGQGDFPGPALRTDLHGAVAVAAAYESSCYLKSDGVVLCEGYDYYGTLGRNQRDGGAYVGLGTVIGYDAPVAGRLDITSTRGTVGPVRFYADNTVRVFLHSLGVGDAKVSATMAGTALSGSPLT